MTRLHGMTGNGTSYEVDFSEAGGDRFTWTLIGRDQQGNVVSESGVIQKPPVGDRDNPHSSIRYNVEEKLRERGL